MSVDPRSERVAVVADARFVEVLPFLRAGDYGVIMLPPTTLSVDAAARALDQVAEQVAEYRRNDYEVVLVDDGAFGTAFDEALARVGVGPLAVVAPSLRSGDQ